jgi:hypothetical protein
MNNSIGAQVAFERERFHCLANPFRSQQLKGLAEGDSDVLQDARVTVTVDQVGLGLTQKDGPSCR